MFTVYINEQEQKGNYTYTGVQGYMTRGFQAVFGLEAEQVASKALYLVQEKYGCNADYLQTFRCEKVDNRVIPFWCINDIEYITFLLPEEY